MKLLYTIIIASVQIHSWINLDTISKRKLPLIDSCKADYDEKSITQKSSVLEIMISVMGTIGNLYLAHHKQVDLNLTDSRDDG